MKVLLIKHPTTHFANTSPPVSGLPLGILYIAAALRTAGHQVQLYDAIVDADEKRWGTVCEDGKYQMGATQEEIGRLVAEAAPDVVGISNQYTSQVDNAIQTAQTVKEVNRAITVVVGGPHASVMPSSFFENPDIVDFAVIGEGEDTMVDLLDNLGSGKDVTPLKGIAYLKDGQLAIKKKNKFITDLDRIQLPAYDLLDMERYFYFNEKGKDGRESYRYPGSHRSVSMITSRGCPFNCIFCSIHLSMGRQFRAHTVTYVLDHIRQIRKNYDIRHIHFEDDNFTLDMDRFNAILDGLITDRFPITWDTPNGVRADYLNQAILEKCKASGCTYLRIGVESANETVSKEIVRKHLDLKTVVDVAKRCQKTGIDLEAFYMIGLPGETTSQMNETIDFAILHERSLGLTPYGMFTATPLIGTDLYKMCVDRGYITSELSSNNMATATQGEGMLSTEAFSPETLKTLLKKYRQRHLIAKALYALKFLCRHPGYLVNRLTTRYYLKQLLPLLKKGQLLRIINDVFLYRYKNCVIRKIGLP
jgi:radical SAM superfamily enzyme YgiQ (UPF0313 family)